MEITIIWDWNGTLLDDVNAAVGALNRMLAKHKLPPVTREFYRANFGFPVRPFYQQVGIDLDRVDWDEICTDFHAFIAAEPQDLHPSTRDALEAARAGGLNQCILSALREDLLCRDTARFGVAPFFDYIFGVDNLDGATKLSRGRDLVATLPPQTRLYFIGDTLHDAEVGAALGAEVILVGCGHQNPERLCATGYPVLASPLAAVQYIQQRSFPQAESFESFRPKLTALAAKHLNPVLSRRLSPEDVVQETFEAALMREDFFTNEPEVPLYFKLRTILFQTMVDLERRHLAAQKRDAYKEVDVPGHSGDETSAGDLDWDMFAGTVTTPNSFLARKDRHALLRQAIGELSENDRQIIILRHFDDMDNAECARVLGIEPKAASIRYVRALERLQKKLVQYTEFQN